jgi:hypothetical protein
LIGRGFPDLLRLNFTCPNTSAVSAFTKLLGILLELGQNGFRPSAEKLIKIAPLAALLPWFHAKRGLQNFLYGNARGANSNH